MSKWQTAFHQFHSLGHDDIENDLLHETHAMLIMKSHLTMDEFLAAGVQGAASVEKQVTSQLDDMAAALSERDMESCQHSTFRSLLSRESTHENVLGPVGTGIQSERLRL